MPALSFQEEWLDMLLRCNKQQTTRLTDRIKVGDIVSMYNQQRRRITDKPLRIATDAGRTLIRQKIIDGKYPKPDVGIIDRMRRAALDHYYAHFLGKVEVTEVYDITPSEMSYPQLWLWARQDGFAYLDVAPAISEMGHLSANDWFTSRYGANWYKQTWAVIRWDGWQERYFEPGSD